MTAFSSALMVVDTVAGSDNDMSNWSACRVEALQSFNTWTAFLTYHDHHVVYKRISCSSLIMIILAPKSLSGVIIT
jgi:hypothetical protein